MTRTLPPCPICHSTSHHSFSYWRSLDDGMKEIPMIQCRDCNCEASIAAWSMHRVRVDELLAHNNDLTERLRVSERRWNALAPGLKPFIQAIEAGIRAADQ